MPNTLEGADESCLSAFQWLPAFAQNSTLEAARYEKIRLERSEEFQHFVHYWPDVSSCRHCLLPCFARRRWLGGNSITLELALERRPADAEHLAGLSLVSVRRLERSEDQNPLGLLERGEGGLISIQAERQRR